MGNWTSYYSTPAVTMVPMYAHFPFGRGTYELKVSSDMLFDYLQNIIIGNKMLNINDLNSMLVSDNDSLLMMTLERSCRHCENKGRIHRTIDRLCVRDQTHHNTAVITTGENLYSINTQSVVPHTSWDVCMVLSTNINPF